MKLNEIKAASSDLYSEINDAASAIGTIKELTNKVRDRVMHHLKDTKGLVTMSDADLQSLIDRAPGEEKFALKIACKVIGRRLPEDLKESVLDKIPAENGTKGDAYVVIGNWGRGVQTTWPKGEAPGVWTKKDAEQIAKDLEADEKGKGAIPGSAGIAWHAKPLDNALEYVGFGNKAYGAIKKLQAKFAE